MFFIINLLNFFVKPNAFKTNVINKEFGVDFVFGVVLNAYMLMTAVKDLSGKSVASYGLKNALSREPCAVSKWKDIQLTLNIDVSKFLNF